MAGSASSTNLTYPSLSADQQKLLLAALTSNNRQRQLNTDQFHSPPPDKDQQATNHSNMKSPSESVDPSKLDSAPPRHSLTSAMPAPTFGSGLFPDIVNDSNDFDVDIDLPGNEFEDGFPFDSALDGDSGEKRKSPEDDDDEDEDGSPKRRESDDKGPKKPGRKPLTSEPTTKRKAQNRAAQRAFRERKEKHLKDLELKVADLEKASESADQEKAILKAQITRLQAEVQDYRKRLSVVGNALNSSSSTDTSPYRAGSTGSNTGFDFPFDFPIFGDVSHNDASPNGTTDLFNSNGLKRESFSRANSDVATPQNTSMFFSNSTSPTNLANNPSPQAYSSNLMANGDTTMTSGFVNFNDASLGFSSLVSSPTGLTNGSTSPTQNGTNPFKFNPNSESSTSNAASPSNSSISHHGPGSSVATSPEPINNTNGDGSSTNIRKSGTNGNLSSFGAYQNSTAQDFSLDLSTFQFDPSLFGTYRDTQQAILGDGEFSGGLYDDYLDFGGFEYYANNNMPKKNTPAPLQSPQEKDEELVINAEDKVSKDPKRLEEQNMMTANKMWAEISTCPKFKSGELDVDSLCSELSKKATCTERGAAIPKAEWEAALWRLVGQEEKSPNESMSDALARSKKQTA